MNKSDDYLVLKSQRGDTKSFELLILKYQRRIFNVIYRIVRDQNVVEDLAQDTFLNAYNSIKNFKRQSSFYTWIYRIAVNISLNYLSKQKNLKTVDDTIMESESVVEKISTYDMSPEKSLGSKESTSVIINAINKLPDDMRLAIMLRDYEGLSYQEASEVMDCPIGTVRSRIFRGRAILKEMLKDHL